MFSDFYIYTKSSLFEATTPTVGFLGDNVATAQSVAFVDLDLDAFELGGEIVWNPPSQVAHITHYLVYMATSAAGADRSLVGTLAEGTEAIAVPEDSPEASHAHIVVYTKSALAEQTTPASAEIVPNQASVQSVAFTDKDLDDGEVGGTVQWQAPADTSLVSKYAVYMAESDAGATRSQVGGLVAAGTYQTSLAVNTLAAAFTHLVVYTKSTLAEQTTPVGLALEDDAFVFAALDFRAT